MSLLVLALFASGCGSKGDTPAGPSTDDVQKALDAAVAKGAPGIAMEIRTPDGDEQLSSGQASLDPARPIEPADHYRIASVTKTFTAAIVMQLVADQKLAPDDSVAKIDPKLLKHGDKVTVADLLGHTSGLADYVKNEEFLKRASAGKRLTPELVLGFVADEPLEFTPGSRYEYSDTDNIVLGLMIEKVTGHSFENELRSRILQPLHLTDTALAHGFEFPKPHASGYQFDAESSSTKPDDVTDVPIDADGAWASGALISTPADVATFFERLLGGDVVPKAQLQEMMKTRPGAGSPPGPGRNRAGLGIFRWKVPCGPIWGHTGSFPGFRAIGAATADGSASFGMVVNATNLPGPAERAVLRAQNLAACRILGKPLG